MEGMTAEQVKQAGKFTLKQFVVCKKSLRVLNDTLQQ